MGILERTKNAYNAFVNKDKPHTIEIDTGSRYGGGYTFPARTPRYSKGSIVDSVTSRIAIDVSELEFSHVKMDKDPTTEEIQDTGLNRCLTIEANIDQNAKDFIQDIVQSMFDEGAVAVVPIDTSSDPYKGTYDIITMRTGKIVQWFPYEVEVRCYNERTGNYDNLRCAKSKCAIIPNPLYEVLNADNATLKRYIRKLRLIDTVDEKNASTKLDMILQTPYSMKSELHKERANRRRKDIEEQLEDSKLGIAYIGPEEKITQLNRSLENNLLTEIQQLREEFFNQLGISQNVFQGTASEAEMQYYLLKVVYPIANRICLEFKRKFLTQTAITQGHDIVYYSNPLQLVPASQVASMGDSMKRNSITTSNEIRKIIGFRPADDPNADLLYNPNMPMDQQPMSDTMSQDPNAEVPPEESGVGASDEEAANILDALDDDQYAQVLDYAQQLVGPDVPQEEIFDVLDDEQFKMVLDMANELLNEETEETG